MGRRRGRSGRHLLLHVIARAGVNMSKQAILLVEDDEDDALLTTRALRKINLANEIVVVNDGALALDYLFATGDYADRDARELPEIVLLELKLRQINGLEVLRRMREDKRTRLLPVIILTSSEEERDFAECYKHGANSAVRKPVDLTRFAEAVRKLGCYWLVVNERIPQLQGKYNDRETVACSDRGRFGRRYLAAQTKTHRGRLPGGLPAGRYAGGDAFGARRTAVGYRVRRLLHAAFRRHERTAPVAAEGFRHSVHLRLGHHRRRYRRDGHARGRAGLHHEGQEQAPAAGGGARAARGRGAARAEAHGARPCATRRDAGGHHRLRRHHECARHAALSQRRRPHHARHRRD